MNRLIRGIGSSCWVPRYRQTSSWGATFRLYSHSDAIKSINTSLQTLLNDNQNIDVQNVRVLNVQRGEQATAVDIVGMLRSRNVDDILSVHSDVDCNVLENSKNTLGNVLEPRVWHGQLESLPAYMGPFQMIIVDADMIEESKKRDILRQCSMITRPGGSIIVWSGREVVLEDTLIEDAMDNLCLEMADSGSNVLVFRVPEHFALRGGIRYMEGEIVTGYGRGSKELGVPTANLLPADVQGEIVGLPAGVYFGWAQLMTSESQQESDGLVHKMVMNIGKRPTFVKDNSPDISIEVHVMHSFQQDFYGQRMKVLVVGYLRPEMKFDTIQELLNRIQTDIGVSRTQLDGEFWSRYAKDPFFD